MSIFSSNALTQSVFEIPDMNGKKPDPGDLIEIFRGNYKHWAVYVGRGYVVHFGADAAEGSGILLGGKGVVMKEQLTNVLNNDKYKINNYLDGKRKPRSKDEIVKAACNLVDTNLTYDLVNYNCEHFATEMRYGVAVSRQAEAGEAGIAEGIVEATAMVAVAASLYQAMKS